MVNDYGIKAECLHSTEKDPIRLIMHMMEKESIGIHGPEHHILDGSCLLTALHNCGLVFDLDAALDEMTARGSNMPGATCGKWGVCGSAASIGAALSIIHKTGPLSGDQYYKDHLNYVSQALGRIAEIGGPRCCKRNAFLSLQTAIDFVNTHYPVELPASRVTCPFSDRNKQCIGRNCPFFKGEKHA